MENKFLKVLEALGEVLKDKDDVIKYQKYEIENLKHKVKEIEKTLVNNS